MLEPFSVGWEMKSTESGVEKPRNALFDNRHILLLHVVGGRRYRPIPRLASAGQALVDLPGCSTKKPTDRGPSDRTPHRHDEGARSSPSLYRCYHLLTRPSRNTS